ncbi:MAG: TonB-dependent receptor plug domain-containing protein [Bacteroidales bacterium]|nr:TonB-dependent receptor plug domain-containing protein [Bacteroidales bacterium]
MKSSILFVLLLSLLSIQISYAQKSNKKIKITGTVVDAASRPVEGAIILIDGVKTDVSTNPNGQFSIKTQSTAKSITVISLFTNTVKTTDIDGRTVVNITLDKAGTNTNAQGPKEKETVDIGYGTSGKDQSSTSGTKTNLNKASSKTYLNIYDMIKSEVPGVQVSGTSIRLQQGTTSLSSPTEVLFVVDGTIVNQIDGLIPSQVRSISLLKGSAASIYGARGANGVLVFTTIK